VQQGILVEEQGNMAVVVVDTFERTFTRQSSLAFGKGAAPHEQDRRLLSLRFERNFSLRRSAAFAVA
jgi:hypothetical protein